MNSGNDNLTPLALGPQSGEHLEPEDLVLYVLELASTEERAAAEQHLATCQTCRSGLAEVREDLGEYALGATPGAEAPVNARARLLIAIQAEPQSPAEPKSQAEPKSTVAPGVGQTPPTAAQTLQASSAPGQPAKSPVLVPGLVPGPVPSVVPGSREIRPAGRVPVWLGWGLAAAMTLVATHFYQQGRSLAGALDAKSDQVARLSSEQAHARAIVDALTDRSAQRVTLNLTKGATPPQPTGRATYLAGKGTLILLASHLAALPAGKTYELWVIPANGTAPVAAGTFHPDASGAANVVTEKLQAGLQAKAFGITIEPEGGSASPTMPIVLAGS